MSSKNFSLYDYNYANSKDKSVEDKNDVLDLLSTALKLDDLSELKRELTPLFKLVRDYTKPSENDGEYLNKNQLIDQEYIDKIKGARTIERAKYYVERIIKGITEYKTSGINDINLNRWKSYNDVITDSLWYFRKRDRTGAHNAKYWGNFIPQIPHQLLLRFTKENDWVLDPFMGSGTTLIESQRLSRNSVGIDVEGEAVELATRNIENEPRIERVVTRILKSDNLEVDYSLLLQSLNIKAFQLVILHPPYWNIIKFSNNSNNFSNFETMEMFLDAMKKLAEKLYPHVEYGRYLALVIGDKYSKGQWIPLGFYTMQKFIDAGYTLKSIIVKNYEDTKGKQNSADLWRYRALVGGFYVFKHEYIFLFKKI